jgi:hypothetical protein
MIGRVGPMALQQPQLLGVLEVRTRDLMLLTSASLLPWLCIVVQGIGGGAAAAAAAGGA